MIYFKNKKTNQFRRAYSITPTNNNRLCVKFNEFSKEYYYSPDTIEIISDTDINNDNSDDIPFLIYTFNQNCWKCNKDTEIITYIIFDDDTLEDVTYPWDKHRLLNNQDLWAHMVKPDIEFYGLQVIGDNKCYDEFLLNAFPANIAIRYSATTETKYAMNICNHCGSQQGNFYVYEQVNKLIQNNIEIRIKFKYCKT